MVCSFYMVNNEFWSLLTATDFWLEKLVSSPEFVRMLYITACCKQLILACQSLFMHACKKSTWRTRNNPTFLPKAKVKAILHRACSWVVSVPLEWILQQHKGMWPYVTEEKRCSTRCRWQRQELGMQCLKLMMKRHCEVLVLDLVHMYSALHAGKKNSYSLLICPQGKEWVKSGP